MKFPLKPLQSGAPNELVQIDHLKLSKTRQGNVGVLMMIDHFTKFAQALPYQACDAKETCRLIVDGWVTLYGAPLAIQSDNGSQFTAELTAELMKCLDILQVHSTPYHPQTNGLVERQNRTLILLLRTICSRQQDDWDTLLNHAVAAYNSTRHSTTGFSPFMLWYGREKRTPMMLLFPKQEKGFNSCKEYLQRLCRRSAKIRQIARVTSREAQIRQKRNFDKNAVHLHPYKPDEKVLVNVKVIPRGGVGKLLRAWRGPYTVKEARQQGRWYILDNGMITHYERLKPYVPRVTEIEMKDEPAEEVQPMPDPAIEVQANEEILPEDEASDEGTFDANSDSELSFVVPKTDDVPASDRVLRPRTPIDYFKVENPDEFQLFCISVADLLARAVDEEFGLLELSLF